MDTLPVEILHRIFDFLDAQTILLSVRALSRTFRSMVKFYDRYILTFENLSQQHFHLLCRLIEPQQVISLTLSNVFRSSHEIDYFLSNVHHLRSFTRLRSLTLENIDETHLIFLLKRINLTSITSFTVSIRKYDKKCAKTTKRLINSIITQSALRQLDLWVTNRAIFRVDCELISMIRYLSISHSIIIDDLCQILRCCPHLHTATLSGEFYGDNSHSMSTLKPQNTFQQLQSLTIEAFDIDIDVLESYLLVSPSLNHLRLIGETQDLTLDGYRWERFIQINLPQLKKFEFFFYWIFDSIKTLEELESINAAFQTPFWIEHRQWFTIFEYHTAMGTEIRMYTIPICSSSFTYDPEFTQLPSPAMTMRIENNNVEEITVELNETDNVSIEKQETIKKYFHFGKVTDLTLDFGSTSSVLLMSSILMTIDMTNIVQMTLADFKQLFSEDVLKTMSSWFEQAHNLRSLEIEDVFDESDNGMPSESITSILPRQLQHLHICIDNVDEIKMLLERCKNLSTLVFIVGKKLRKKIKQWFVDNTINSICWDGEYSLIVWLGKINIQHKENKMDNKRMKIDSSA